MYKNRLSSHHSRGYFFHVSMVLTHKITVEALAELEHARSVGQRPRDVKRLTT